MLAPLYAGFLIAWTVVYLAAACYSAWASSRPHPDAGTGVLATFFGMLALASGAMASAMLTEGHLTDLLTRVSHAALMPAPVLLVHFARSEEPTQARNKLLVTGYSVSVILAAVAMTGAYDAAPLGPHAFDAATTAGKAAAVVFAGGIFAAAYYLGRAQTRSKTLGVGPFVGALFLCVFAVYDCVTALAGTPRPVLCLAGFTAFTLALFVGQIIRLARRREHLVSKTAELSKKSKALSKSFRELRARQDELVRKEQLAAIGELSAVIAHEVRNPLAIMSNAVATLRRANVNDEARETLLGILSEEGARLNQLVGDLLHYAKPLALERQSVNVFDLVKKAVVQVDDKPNVLLRVTQAESVPKVGGDPLLLRQAVDNLVNNALQAMSNGGTLTVEVSAAAEGPRGAELLIRDTGEGMDTVVRKRALDPFFTTRPSGTGLGLAIVARVIDAHGGRLTIRSERDAGTEVRVYLPCNEDEAPARTGKRVLQPVIEPFPADERGHKKEAS